MNILVLGSGGREHALAMTYAKSKKVTHVYVAPGNGLIGYNQKNISSVSDLKISDKQKLLSWIQKNTITLVDVATDDLLATGYVDFLQKNDVWAFGPSQKAAQIEWDKSWSRNFMKTYNLPIPHYAVFTDKKKAISYINSNPDQLVFIKASGLAAGKGVIKATTKKEAIEAIKQMEHFGKSGETFVIEQGLIGEEFSLFAICDGVSAKVIGYAQDHKTIWNGNEGPNTGGMGCVSPNSAVDKKIIDSVEKQILKPFITGMNNEERPYMGILYVGGMITKSGVQIIEFNARWGDPEAQVILPSLQTDYVDLVTAVKNQTLHKIIIKKDAKIRVSVTISAKGYPGDSSAVKGKKISSVAYLQKKKNILSFGAGIERKENTFFVSGGRVLHVVGSGNDIRAARERVYEAASSVFFADNTSHFRTDIGWQDMEKFYAKKKNI